MAREGSVEWSSREMRLDSLEGGKTMDKIPTGSSSGKQTLQSRFECRSCFPGGQAKKGSQE